MMNNELMRRRPGQRGCCGCGLAAVLGLGTLIMAALWSLVRPGRQPVA
jgi:hypothetical protein